MPSVEAEHASIYYEAGGEGPPLVLAHGAGGNTLVWWQQTRHFEARHRVIRFDHRSFGRSTCAPEHFHPRHFVADLLAVLDAEGVERAALVCQSMGGWTGLHTALQHPERVACLVLCGTPAGIASEAVLAAATRIGRRSASEGIRGNAALAPDFPQREPARAHLYDLISGLNNGFDPAGLARLFDPAARVDPARLAGFTVPSLLVAGAQDQLFPPEALREVAACIPGAELREFAGAGHSVYYEEPEAFNRVVGDFVARHLR